MNFKSCRSDAAGIVWVSLREVTREEENKTYRGLRKKEARFMPGNACQASAERNHGVTPMLPRLKLPSKTFFKPKARSMRILRPSRGTARAMGNSIHLTRAIVS